jgi:hypothetical protein
MNKKTLLILLVIVIVVFIGLYLYFWKERSQLKEAETPNASETPNLSEKTKAPTIKEIKDNDLIMSAVRSESGASQELLANSCVSSIMQETDDLILVYISWNCGDVGGGTRAILKKQDAQYKFIAMFQDPPSCALMKEYSVPKSFYESCY